MIDWNQVSSLRDDLGEGFDELVDVFLAEADEAVAALDPAAPPARMAAALHFLKGAALNLGFADFAGVCAKGETLSDAGGAVDLGPILGSYRASRQVFLDGLARQKVA